MKVLLFILLFFVNFSVITNSEDTYSQKNVIPASRAVILKWTFSGAAYKISLKELHDTQFIIEEEIQGPRDDFLIQNLKPCTSYEILLKSENNILLQEKFQTLPEAPSAVQNIFSNLQNENLTITWDAPIVAPRCVRYYELNITYPGQTFPLFRITNETKISINNWSHNIYNITLKPAGEDLLKNGDINVEKNNIYDDMDDYMNYGRDLEVYIDKPTIETENRLTTSSIIFTKDVPYETTPFTEINTPPTVKPDIFNENTFKINNNEDIKEKSIREDEKNTPTLETALTTHATPITKVKRDNKYETTPFRAGNTPSTSKLEIKSVYDATFEKNTPTSDATPTYDTPPYDTPISDDNLTVDTYYFYEITDFNKENTPLTVEPDDEKINNMEGVTEIFKRNAAPSETTLTNDMSTMDSTTPLAETITSLDETTIPTTTTTIDPSCLGKVKNLEGTLKQYNEIELKWEPPCATATFSYNIKVDGKMEAENKTTKSILLPNLDICTKYVIGVIAIMDNDEKNENQEEIVTTYTATNEDITDINTVWIRSNSTFISWKTPNNCLVKYNVSWDKGGTNPTTTNSNTILEKLNSCSSYTVEVKGDIHKWPLKGTTLQFKTQPKNGDFHGDVKIIVGTTNVALSWNMKEKCDFFYDILLLNKSTSIVKEKINATNISLPDLQPCTLYHFAIRSSFNSWSQVNNLNIITTLPTNQSVQAIKTFTDAQNLTITWEPPSCNYFKYNYIVRGSNNFTRNTTNNYVDLDKLNPCTAYNISITPTIIETKWIGEETVVPVSTEPDIQGAVSFEEINIETNTLDVTWNLPNTWGTACSANLKYLLEIYDANKIKFQKNITEISQKVSNLDACTKYKIQITLIYKKQYLRTNVLEKTTKYAKPGKIFLKVTEIISSKKYSYDVILQWNSTNEKCISDYVYEELPTGTKYNISKDKNSHSLFDLKLCINYTFTITSISQNNDDNEVEIYYEKTDSNEPPVLMNNLENPCNNCLTNWTVIGNNCPLLSLDIECEAIQRPEVSPECSRNINISQTLNGTNNLTIIVPLEKLDPWTNYTCIAKITNEADTSNYSDSFDVETTESAPDEPTNVKFIVENMTLKSSWGPPTCFRGNLNGYKVKLLYKGDNFNVRHDCQLIDINFPEVDITSTTWEDDYQFFAANYELCVKAYTDAGNSSCIWKNLTTDEAVPQPPEIDLIKISDCDKDCDTFNRNLSLSWRSPCAKNGIVLSYKTECNCCENNETIETTAEDKKEYYKKENMILKPAQKCTVKVTTVNNKGESLSAIQEFVTPSGVPVVKENTTFITKITNTSLSINVANTFTETMGKILYYAVIVYPISDITDSTFGYWNCSNENQWPKEDYQRTEDYFKGYLFKIDILEPNTSYAVKVRGFTGVAYRDTPLVTITTVLDEVKLEGVPIGLVIGIISGIVAITLIIAILYLAKGRLTYLKNCPITRRRLFGRSSEAELALDTSVGSAIPPAVPILKFVEYYTSMTQHDGRISNEFQLLNTLCADINSQTRNAALPPNRRKNRYINILPYDENRVRLKSETSDYINASYIKGYSDNIDYIAAQGPTESTHPAFWRLVFDENIKIIAMLTQLVEQDKEKCYKYYPNVMDEIEFEVEQGFMRVLCTLEENHEIHTLRKFILIQGTERKEVQHILFNKWPDFGVPTNVSEMLHFYKTFMHLRHDIPGMVLVHCSAGVGRTGTLIALDILHKTIVRKQKIDIFNTVLNLRKQRMMMVQSEKQYEFLYKCVQEIILIEEKATMIK